MDSTKQGGFNDSGSEKDEEFALESGARARNRTVMLTPEITSQVRSRLAKEMDPPAPPAHGFRGAPEGAGGSTYSPAGGHAHHEAPPPAAYTPAAPRAAVPQQGARPLAVWSKLSPIVGFLVSYDKNTNGDVYELRSGRLIVTSEAAAAGNYMLVDDATVSPMHAIMRISASGEIQVLDQLSEHGTKIRRFGSKDEQELSGDKSSLEHGDVIKFGARAFHVCLVTRGDGE